MAQSTGARSLGGDGKTGGAVDTRGDGRHTGMTPAQWYCLLAGAALLLAGIFGFLADSTFDTGGSGDTDATGNADGQLQGDSFLGFEVNGWHNIVHLLSGLVLLASFRKRGPAKAVALAFGLVYGLVTLIGLIDGNDILGILPVNAADNILHLALSAAGILASLVSPKDEHRSHGSTGGTHSPTTVERDSRFGRDGEVARSGSDFDPLSGRARDDRHITRTD